MIELLHDLSRWLTDFASSPWAMIVLGVSSFFESIVFPIPPDPLLIAMSALQPHLAIWFGVIVTLSSVAGAVVGHWIGRRFGRPVLLRMFHQRRVDMVEGLFQRYGMWAVLVAAVTPIPYKVFAISAGALDMDRRTFIIASLIGRGARFISVAVLVMVFGRPIEDFISENFEILTVAFAVGVIAIAIAATFVLRSRRARDALR